MLKDIRQIGQFLKNPRGFVRERKYQGALNTAETTEERARRIAYTPHRDESAYTEAYNAAVAAAKAVRFAGEKTGRTPRQVNTELYTRYGAVAERVPNPHPRTPDTDIDTRRRRRREVDRLFGKVK